MGGRQMRASLLVACALLLPLALSSPSAWASGGTEKESRPVVDATQVYFGKAASTKAPAVVDADQLFRAIPEYRKILDDRLTETDPKYSLLLVKATRKFRAAVEAAATAGGYDLVGNVGSVTWPGHEVPDITAAVLLKLEEAERARS